MDETSKDYSINKEIEIKKEVEKRLEKKELEDNLSEIKSLIKESLKETSSVYPEIIKSLSNMRKSVESLTLDLEVLSNDHKDHFSNEEKMTHDVNIIFHKLRDMSKFISDLENKIIDRNNSSSLLEVVTGLIIENNKVLSEKIEDQNVKMVDRNNPHSILSILKKEGRVQNRITWILVTVATILTLLAKIFNITVPL